MSSSSKAKVRSKYKARVGRTRRANRERVAIFKVGTDDSECDEVMDDSREEELFVAHASCWDGLLIHISQLVKWMFFDIETGERGMFGN